MPTATSSPCSDAGEPCRLSLDGLPPDRVWVPVASLSAALRTLGLLQKAQLQTNLKPLAEDDQI